MPFPSDNGGKRRDEYPQAKIKLGKNKKKDNAPFITRNVFLLHNRRFLFDRKTNIL